MPRPFGRSGLPDRLTPGRHLFRLLARAGTFSRPRRAGAPRHPRIARPRSRSTRTSAGVRSPLWGSVPLAFRRIAIVNRGEPAVRFIKAVRDYNRLHGESIVTIALYTDGDQRSRFVREADERVELGPESDDPESWRRRAYLDPMRLERALLAARADAAWAGWGFVAERPEFVDLCQRIGITFIGPPASAMRLLGDKISAKRLAAQVGVPVVPWGGAVADSIDTARLQAQSLGFPVVVKAAVGVGGRAVHKVSSLAELADAFAATRQEARRTFGNDTVFVEQWIDGSRHREVQIVADHRGTTWAVDVRGATVQRRHQKVLEESPAPDLPLDVDRAMRASAVRLCRAAGFENVGAVEFLYEPASRQFHFMEVNPWLQVEHPVTELTTGLDLAMLQIDLARGGLLRGNPPVSNGHAVEVRITAEDAERGFTPAPGVVRVLRVPTRTGLRLDSGVNEGDVVRPEYDSMFAKLIGFGRTRDEALDTLAGGLADATIIVEGGVSNRAFLEHLARRPEVRAANVTVDWLDDIAARGQHVSREHGDVALLQAAIDVYEAEFVNERDEFFASAQRFRPRVSPDVGRVVEFRYRGHRYTLRTFRLSVEHYRIDTDGTRVDVWVDPIAANVRTLTCGGARYRVITSRVGTTHLIEVGGALHRVSRDAEGDIRALGPAVVVSLWAKAGEHVVAGQRVATLESMKMETDVLAPCSGTVRETSVMANAQVGAGTRLMVIEPDEAPNADDNDERVRFGGTALPPSLGGKTASRGRAALVGLKAFAGALSTPDLEHAHAVLDDLRALMHGSDIDAAEARRLVDDYRRTCDRLPHDEPSLLRREDEMLEVFADISSLFRRQAGPDEADDPTALSTGQYFLTYLRTIEARGADLPQAFVSDLQRALRHYGSDSLEVTNALKSRLFWMYKSHQRVDHQAAVVLAILDRRLRQAPALLSKVGSNFMDVVGRLIETSEGQFPTLTDLARDVRYRYFEQPVFERGRQAVYAEMEAHLAHVMRDPDSPDREARIQALVDCPLPLGGLLSGRFEDAAPVLRQIMLEVLTRRFYRIRGVGQCDTHEIGGRSLCLGRYEHDGQHLHLVASHARWAELPAALEAMASVTDGRPTDDAALFDVYVWRDETAGTPDDTVRGLADILDATAFRRPVRRIVVALAGRRADWSASGTEYYTFRHEDGHWREDRVYRGLQPMIGKRLGVARFQKFVIERLPSVEDVFLFRATARDNAKDERLFALAEVRDATPVRDEEGTLLQVPHLERMVFEAVAAIREVQAHRGPDERLHWNRIVLDVWPPLTIPRDELLGVMRRLAAHTDGLGLEKVVLRARMPVPESGELRDTALSMSTAGGHGLVLQFTDPSARLIEPLDEYTQKVVRMRQRNLIYPYEVVRLLTPTGDHTDADMPPGEFVEHDLDADGRLVPVERPFGRNTANVVVGIVRNFTPKCPEGVTRVIVLGDPSKEVGSVAEPECSRILAGLNLAEAMGVPFEWFSLSAGAKISMESGTENMDWIGRVLRKLIEFTQAGREVNIVVTGINVGAQPYWNAEATMLMHTRGILVMMPESAMVLTGKTALDYSGSVSAEDNLGIGGYERIMGPNGQAQYFARDLAEACRILLRHYDHTYMLPGDRFPRRAETTDPGDRDVRTFPHGRLEGADFQTVGDVFSDATNPGRKKPFDIRRVMLAVSDQDHQPLERWAGWRDAEIAVVWDAHVGGYPVCMLGFESRSMSRLGFVPTDGPDHWTSGTLFPMASKKVARAINAASDNRPLVVIANLSGFDGSPESMRRRQLEFGAEIGRAITNFRGPIVFVVISRYHGGAFVVFSRTLHDNMQVAALEGTFASVIGGAPAAAVVFARDVDQRTRKDARVVTLERELAAADEEGKRRLRARLAALIKSVRSEKLGEVAEEFDRIHSIQRAVKVGSVDQIIPASELRPWIIGALESGMAKELERLGLNSGPTAAD
ncbi:MAG: ATP-grasp domain-containing protein [Acidobacteria bacterium]|nr:ATP-grasp domain-containing protein [Acidobacteriota bacterium]